jgi:adenosylcobinamide-phosphate synthase
VNTMPALMILFAFFLDLVLGDPRWLPHPVRGIGWMIGRIETALRRFTRSPGSEKIAGVLLVMLIVLTVYGFSTLLLFLAFSYSSMLGSIIAAFLAYTTLAARDLAQSARAVLVNLEDGDLAGARHALSMIVGRDTANLDEQGVIRAVVETVAENASDGVVAPLFYLALGGPALAMAYKAVNTLDSMVGYKNTRYRNFGWAAARLDDLANFVPARITAVLLSLAAWCLPGASGGNAFHISFRDGRKHASPNSGYPEAAVAGALGLRLGGPGAYGGVVLAKPYIGDEQRYFDKKCIEKSIRLMYCATTFAVLTAVFAAQTASG